MNDRVDPTATSTAASRKCPLNVDSGRPVPQDECPLWGVETGQAD